MVANPGLGWAIQAHDAAAQGLPAPSAPVQWQDLPPHLYTFWQIVSGHVSERHRAGRLKQWLNFLRKHYPEAEVAYTHVRTLTNPKDINSWFDTMACAPA
jgi:tRNA-dihydrouridine synthase C